AKLLKGAAHITGGGITDNTPRILPKGLGVSVRLGSWPILPVFELLQSIGNIPDEDFRRTFNLGIGMIFVVARKDLARVSAALKKLGEAFHEIGEVVKVRGRAPRVAYE